jgi:small subunit ribosomal protein S17
MAKNQPNIGLKVEIPSKKTDDKNCPFYGGLRLRGRIFTGTVLKDPFHKTVTIEFPRRYYLHKYERYEKRRSRIKAHVPDSLEVKKGDIVRIMESRKISKTKSFVVIEVKK